MSRRLGEIAMPKDNRPPPDPAILELARAMARQMARDDFDKGIRWVNGQPVQHNPARLEDDLSADTVPKK
jgi:hypothetical protein